MRGRRGLAAGGFRTAVALMGFAAGAAGAVPALEVPPEAARSDAALSRFLPALAARVAVVYRESNRRKYLDGLFRLQMVAGQDAAALESLAALRKLPPERGAWAEVPYEILAKARASRAADESLADAYGRAFREVMGTLDDRTSALAIRAMRAVNRPALDRTVDAERKKLEGRSRIPLDEALRLVRDAQVRDSYRAFTPLAAPLMDEDDARRYDVAQDLRVETGDGASVCTIVVRPRTARPLPALLEFTIYVDPVWNLEDALLAASHGYVGVVGRTRGKACSPGNPVPYLHDGADAGALIRWTAAQGWSDGRVGMWGGSYNGFTTWAAAKTMPKALRAIAVGAPNGPGIDTPMEGNVFWNFVYPWPFYTTDLKGPDDAIYGDTARWNRLNREWYVSGRAYRDLDKIDGKPNPIFDEWVSHPDYDAYWRDLLPTPSELARIDIPVLQTAGYYFGGPGAAVPYLERLDRDAPRAESYLLIGPWDHFGAQTGVFSLLGGVRSSLDGLELDPAALLDIEEIRYGFFDSVFKGAARPALLKDRINYEVTGADEWKHAPSLAAMADGRLRLYLSAERSGNARRLSRNEPAPHSFVPLTVNLADRSDADRKAPGGGVVDDAIDTANGIEFMSDPLPSATETSGLFSGSLDLVVNKKDFDFEIDLYERTPEGKYVQLAPYWTRASYAGHPDHRQLLTPGKRERLDFTAIRLMSRRLAAGSRVVLVLSVIKSPEREINYGTGGTVADETIRDAGAPLEIDWYGDSHVDLPVARESPQTSGRK